MAIRDADPLVTTDWLAQHLDDPDIRVVDATWFLPTVGRDARAEYRARHIPGAVFFDLDEVCPARGVHPHPLPDPVRFSSRVRQLGLGDGVRIVLYDDNNYCASARVWWLFRVFGHPEVSVLDGGLKKWQAEGRPLTDEEPRPRERHFTPRQNNLLVRELDQIRANLTARREQIVDARSPGRFRGIEPEPRPGLRAGHIPGSLNLHYLRLIHADGTLAAAQEIATIFAEAGVDLSRPIVTSCGSGVSAAVLNLALARLGRTDAALYDGSWVEWGSRPDTPVAT
jgi:thiosulfate/3-mercaptopyruvate sulfurtransferase